MRILIAVMALFGLAVAIQANKTDETTFLESVFGIKGLFADYPFELYPIPARGNRSLENYAAVSFLVFIDATMYSKKLTGHLTDIELGKTVPTNSTLEINDLISNLQNVVENAYSYNYETIEQLLSEVGRADYDTVLYTTLIIEKNTDKQRRDNLWTNLRNLFNDGSNKTQILSEVETDFKVVHDDLPQNNKNVAQLIKGCGINPYYFYRQQMERLFVAPTWIAYNIVTPQQEVDEHVDKYIKEHGYYMPIYDN